MKKIFNFPLLSFAILLIITSCSEEIIETDIENVDDSQVSLEASYESSYSLLDYTPNNYYNFFETTDNTIGFSSLNPGALQEKSIYKTNALTAKGLSMGYSINDTNFSSKSGSEKLEKSDSDNIFGKTVKISFQSKSGSTFKDGTTKKEVEMYVPNQLELFNPLIENENDLVPYCFYKDFVLEWNADPKNLDGLVVTVEYHGSSAVPDKARKINILNTDVIKVDNGKAVLDNDIWDGIPDTGIVTLTLLRGNVKIEEIDEENYKFFAEARVVLPLILIRDIDTIE